MSNTLSETAIREALIHYPSPFWHGSMLDSKHIQGVDCSEQGIAISLKLGFPAKNFQNELKANLSEYLKKTFAVKQVDITVTWQVQAHAIQTGLKTLPQVKNIIAIASGKGGVGKSTTAVNIALALQTEGGKVGILDADIYGPSQPHMLGQVQPLPENETEAALQPVTCHGLQTMSIAYLVDPNTAMIWRGPMVSGALQQLLQNTAWQDLDYLIVDLPPGTGDIQLTLAQKIPVSGAIIVTTPQDIALLDARRSIAMFQKVAVPVLGVVENMSVYVCKQCGHPEHLFGQGGGERLAQEYDVNLLGQIPLDISIRQWADGGTPTVVAEPNGAIAKAYRDAALHACAILALQSKSYTAKFPTIIVENK